MSIKSISSALSICVCPIVLFSNANAAFIIDDDVGLTSPDIVIDFGNNLFSVGTEIDIEFQGSGVTFGPTYTYNDSDTAYLSLTQGYLENSNTSNQPGSILFSVDVTAADFSWRTFKSTETTFAAYIDNALVEEFKAGTNSALPLTNGRYYGFENILFDEIRFTINDNNNRGFTLDNLKYVSAIPVPAAVWLFGSGLLGLIGVARRNS